MTLDRVLRASHSGRRGVEALALHQQLLRLVGVRDLYRETIGRLVMLFQMVEGWKHVGFASFAEWCEERLRMDVGDVERLAAQARREVRRERSADVRGE